MQASTPVSTAAFKGLNVSQKHVWAVALLQRLTEHSPLEGGLAELPSAAEWSDPRGSEKQDAARFRGKSELGGSRPLPTGVLGRASQRLENRPTDRVSRTPAHCEGRGDLCPPRGARAAHHAKEAPPTAPPPEASTPVTSGPEPGGAARRHLRVTPQSDQQNVSLAAGSRGLRRPASHPPATPSLQPGSCVPSSRRPPHAARGTPGLGIPGQATRALRKWRHSARVAWRRFRKQSRGWLVAQHFKSCISCKLLEDWPSLVAQW
ncbi:uncharacterized protein [Bos indicus]|uniref:Uncharacterized protein n=1 Tax=Bos indicus TaxID=9915 RepID=A0ABM4RGM9_BOSIN